MLPPQSTNTDVTASSSPATPSTPAGAITSGMGIYKPKLLSMPIQANTNVSIKSTPFQINLQYGMTYPDVRALQKYLNAHGFLLASSGFGSPGFETDQFGPLTKAALIKFQLASRIDPASGYFGPLTRDLLNQLIE